jgi:hypothetical protein
VPARFAPSAEPPADPGDRVALEHGLAEAGVEFLDGDGGRLRTGKELRDRLVAVDRAPPRAG